MTGIGNCMIIVTIKTFRVTARWALSVVVWGRTNLASQTTAAIPSNVAVTSALVAPLCRVQVFLDRVTSKAKYHTLWHEAILPEFKDSACELCRLNVSICLRRKKDMSPHGHYFTVL